MLLRLCRVSPIGFMKAFVACAFLCPFVSAAHCVSSEGFCALEQDDISLLQVGSIVGHGRTRSEPTDHILQAYTDMAKQSFERNPPVDKAVVVQKMPAQTSSLDAGADWEDSVKAATQAAKASGAKSYAKLGQAAAEEFADAEAFAMQMASYVSVQADQAWATSHAAEQAAVAEAVANLAEAQDATAVQKIVAQKAAAAGDATAALKAVATEASAYRLAASSAKAALEKAMEAENAALAKGVAAETAAVEKAKADAISADARATFELKESAKTAAAQAKVTAGPSKATVVARASAQATESSGSIHSPRSAKTAAAVAELSRKRQSVRQLMTSAGSHKSAALKAPDLL